MSNPFVAEIRIFAGNFAPTGWALCNGQLMPISQNTALFSLLGTTYGGDGKSTFALPDLQGMAPMNQGQGPGLSDRFLGESSGSPSVTLLTTEMPAHQHQAQAGGAGDQVSPTNNSWGTLGTTRTPPPLYATTANAQMSPFALSIAGSSLPHNNMSPYLCLTFIIALQGVFPARP
jgi:microcystin-dependent protein